MSLFNSLFKNSSTKETSEITERKLDWTYLTDLGQLNDINIHSNSEPALIFKHSTRCSISRMALKQFENEFKSSSKVALYFLDLLENRPISAAISTQFNVVHQSPQLLLIKNGVTVYTVSHSAIDAQELMTNL